MKRADAPCGYVRSSLSRYAVGSGLLAACPRSIGESTSPGHTALTRTPTGASSNANARVRLVTPPFDAQYTAAPALPCTPASDDMLTMQPRVAVRYGMAAALMK